MKTGWLDNRIHYCCTFLFRYIASHFSYRRFSRPVEEGVEGVAQVLADGLRVAPSKEGVRLVYEQQ